MTADRRHFEFNPHPGYGPCDGFGGDGNWCATCAEGLWSLFDALTAERCRCRIRITKWHPTMEASE